MESFQESSTETSSLLGNLIFSEDRGNAPALLGERKRGAQNSLATRDTSIIGPSLGVVYT
jgi:hypothetical protein